MAFYYSAKIKLIKTAEIREFDPHCFCETILVYLILRRNRNSPSDHAQLNLRVLCVHSIAQVVNFPVEDDRAN
jgi:hypothetical protein